MQAGAGGAVPQDLSSIPAEDLGAALSKLMSVDMATQAEVDSGKLQQMMKFVLGAVQTLATEQQESKLARTAMEEAQAALTSSLAQAEAGLKDVRELAGAAPAVADGIPDWANEMRQQILDAAAADAKAQQEAAGLSAVQGLQGTTEELQRAHREQADQISKMAEEMASLRAMLAAASSGGDPAAMEAAMAEAEEKAKEAAEAARLAREKEDAERKSLKDEMAAMEAELARVLALQTELQASVESVANASPPPAVEVNPPLTRNLAPLSYTYP